MNKKQPERCLSCFGNILVFFRRLVHWMQHRSWETNTSLTTRLIKQLPSAGKEELVKIQKIYAQLLKGNVKPQKQNEFNDGYRQRAAALEKTLLKEKGLQPLTGKLENFLDWNEEAVLFHEGELNESSSPHYLASLLSTVHGALNHESWGGKMHLFYTQLLQGMDPLKHGPEEIKLACEIILAKIPLLSRFVSQQNQTPELVKNLSLLTWKIMSGAEENKEWQPVNRSEPSSKALIRKNLKALVEKEIEKPPAQRSSQQLKENIQILFSLYKNPEVKKSLEVHFKNSLTKKEWNYIRSVFSRPFIPLKFEDPRFEANQADSPYGKKAKATKAPKKHPEGIRQEALLIASFWETLFNRPSPLLNMETT